MSHTASLQSISQYDRAMVGGKELNLSKLISANLPVPSGFLVLTTGI